VPSWNVAGRKLRFGLIGGIPLTGGLYQPASGELQGYLGGLAIEVKLKRRVSIELNGLYRPFRGDLSEFTVLTWQFPVLAKYRFRAESRVQPVLEAGPSFRLSGNLNRYNPSRYGITAGGGVETCYKALKIGPVLRYTRWTRDPVRSGIFFRGPRTASNQVELLVAFTF